MKHHINWSLLIDPCKYYPVNYTIKQDGTRVIGETLLIGADMTENQIKEFVRYELAKKKTQVVTLVVSEPSQPYMLASGYFPPNYRTQNAFHCQCNLEIDSKAVKPQ
ncbi:hypothetical protein [Rufibacter soli]